MEQMRQYEVNSFWFPFDYTKKKPFQYLRLVWQLFSLFRKIKPDAVHTNLFDDSLSGIFAAKLAGVKNRILTKQDTGFHILYQTSMIKFDRFNNRNATHIVPTSNDTKELILKHESPATDKVTVIPHGMSEKMVTRSTNQQKNDFLSKYNLQNKTVIGSVGRYIEIMGYRYIIEAAKLCVQKNSLLHFLFIGDGPQKEELENLIREHNLQKYITLTGRIDFDLIPAAYQCMDIFVHSAEAEPFGFVFPEAMFNKVPVVSTAVGAVKDGLTHKVNAYITKFKDPEDIASGIEFMLHHDRKEIAEKAYLVCREKYTVERMWNDYKKLYSE